MLMQVGKWLGVLVAGGTLVAGTVGALTYVFATKQELIDVEKVQTEARIETQLRDYRIQRLEVQVENVEKIATRTDKNVEKLLLMRRLQPAPKPLIKPLPVIPDPDSLRARE